MTSDGKQAMGAKPMSAEEFYEVWCKKEIYHRLGPTDFRMYEAFNFAEAYAAQIARHTEIDEQELRHYRELDASDPYEYRCGPCCGDAHMLLETSLEHIKTLGFEVETIAKESITEIHWHNRRAEKAEAELIARHSAAPDGGSDKVKWCLRFIRQCVSGKCDELDLEVIRGEIDGVLAEGHSAAEPTLNTVQQWEQQVVAYAREHGEPWSIHAAMENWKARALKEAEGHAQVPAQPVTCAMCGSTMQREELGFYCNSCQPRRWQPQAAPAQQWISVGVDLPETPQMVLVAMITGVVGLGGYYRDLRTWSPSGIVTHWQPLPAPPSAGTTSNAHVTRHSDSSLYDEVCIHCGATDRNGPIDGICPKAWKCPSAGTEQESGKEKL